MSDSQQKRNQQLHAELDRLRAEINKTYSEWCGRDLMHLPLSEAVGQVVSCLRAENADLRQIIGECAKSVGAAAGPECSLKFLAEVPTEISLVVTHLRRQLAEAWSIIKMHEQAQLAEADKMSGFLSERKPEECEWFEGAGYCGQYGKLQQTICPCAAWTKGEKK